MNEFTKKFDREVAELNQRLFGGEAGGPVELHLTGDERDGIIRAMRHMLRLLSPDSESYARTQEIIETLGGRT